jgi:hypothetical protein
MSATAAGTEGQAGGAARGQAPLDRMDRLPGWPLPRFDLLVLGLAYFFVFYDQTDIGFGLPAIVKQFSLSSNDVKFVAIAIGLVGYIVGSNLIGALADWRGRRLAFPHLAARVWPGITGHRVRDWDRLAVDLALPDRYGRRRGPQPGVCPAAAHADIRHHVLPRVRRHRNHRGASGPDRPRRPKTSGRSLELIARPIPLQ